MIGNNNFNLGLILWLRSVLEYFAKPFFILDTIFSSKRIIRSFSSLNIGLTFGNLNFGMFIFGSLNFGIRKRL